MIKRLIFLVFVFCTDTSGMSLNNHNHLFLTPQSHNRRQTIHDEETLLEKIRFQGAFDAAYHCELPRLCSLVEAININQTNQYGYPIIFSAIKGAHANPSAPVEKVLDFLIEKGACIDILGFKHKMTALTYATIQAAKSKTLHLKVLEYFITQSADPYLIPLGKKSAFDVAQCLAKKGGDRYPQAKNVVKFFRKQPKNLEEAIIAYNHQAVQKLATPEAIHIMNRYQKKPLYTAITNFYEHNKSHMLEIIALLLARGANPNEPIELMPHPGYTPLVIATIVSLIRADYSMLSLLISAGGAPYKPAIPHHSPSAYKIALVASELKDDDIEDCATESTAQLQTILKNKSIAREILQLFAITRNTP